MKILFLICIVFSSEKCESLLLKRKILVEVAKHLRHKDLEKFCHMCTHICLRVHVHFFTPIAEQLSIVNT
jgi:hypothetical protein